MQHSLAFNHGLIKDADAVGIKARDDHTLLIETAQLCPYLPLIMSYKTSVPVPRWQVEKYGERDGCGEAGAMYDEAERILASDAGGVFVYHQTPLELRKPWLKGVEKNKAGHHAFLQPVTFTRVYIGKR